MLLCQKIVYGEVESEHQYQYYDNGILKSAKITEDDEVREIHFNELGEMVWINKYFSCVVGRFRESKPPIGFA